MEAKLPVHKIFETDFLVDVENAEIRELENESNKIRFEDMSSKDLYYFFYYNQETRGLVSERDADKPHVVMAAIPTMTFLDPDRMAKKYGVDRKGIEYKSDADVCKEAGQQEAGLDKGVVFKGKPHVFPRLIKHRRRRW